MPNQNKSVASDIGGQILGSPAVQGAINNIVQELIARIFGGIGGLFNRKPKVVITEPTPAPIQVDEDFPDDIIPPPPSVTSRKVTSVRLKLARAQYNKKRFPEMYTDENPQGLVRDLSGNIPYDSKFWLDLTAFDAAGKEFLRDAVLANGLAYKTEIHCGDAYIIGKGADASGEPVAGYETNDTDAIGNGITAWLSSLGFLHQMKAYGEGEFECSGSVAGVPANNFTLKVS
jgi:hypothetical protein